MTRKNKVTNEEKAFGRFDNGFTLTFENGLVLSTRFGAMNYCENRSGVLDALAEHHDDTPLFSDNAEVAVWLNNDETDASYDWINGWQKVVFGDAAASIDIRGWVTMPEWLQIVDWCKEWKR